MTNFFIFLRRSLQLIITLLSLLIATFAILLCLAMAGCPIASAEPISSDYEAVPLVVDMDKIAMIESSNNPMSYNKKTGAKGLYQITQICLDDYNYAHIDKFAHDCMFDPDDAYTVANWYLNKRIPFMLYHYNIHDTLDNRLIAWHDGIGNLKKYLNGERKLGNEMKGFINKYFE